VSSHAEDDLFRRHLDLAPLRGRRRGVTHCRFHGEDRRPSLSVDLDRGLFHCFSCGEQGGPARFAELVGERRRPARPGPHGAASEWTQAWRRIQRVNLLQAERRAAWAPWWRANDAVRIQMHAVREARGWASLLGPDHPRTWPLLALAARTETAALVAEAQLEALLAEGRLQLDADDAVEPIVAAIAGRR